MSYISERSVKSVSRYKPINTIKQKIIFFRFGQGKVEDKWANETDKNTEGSFLMALHKGIYILPSYHFLVSDKKIHLLEAVNISLLRKSLVSV